MRYIARVAGVWLERQGERLWEWGSKQLIQSFYDRGIISHDEVHGDKPW